MSRQEIEEKDRQYQEWFLNKLLPQYEQLVTSLPLKESKSNQRRVLDLKKIASENWDAIIEEGIVNAVLEVNISINNYQRADWSIHPANKTQVETQISKKQIIIDDLIKKILENAHLSSSISNGLFSSSSSVLRTNSRVPEEKTPSCLCIMM